MSLKIINIKLYEKVSTVLNAIHGVILRTGKPAPTVFSENK